MSLPCSSILLYSVIVTPDGEDKFWWFLLEKEFVVSSFYNALACNDGGRVYGRLFFFFFLWVI